MIRFDIETAANLIAAMDDQDDDVLAILGIDDRERGILKIRDDGAEMLADHLSGLLSTPNDHRRRAIAQIMAGSTEWSITEGSSALLAHAGIDRHDIVLLLHMLGDDRLVLSHGPDCDLILDAEAIHTGHDVQIHLDMGLGDEIAWNDATAFARLTVRTGLDIPMTVRTAFAGRPLKDVVSHPVMDGLPLTIHHTTDDDDGTVDLVVDGGAVFRDALELDPA